VKQARFANQSARPRRSLARDRLAPAARRHVGDARLRGVRRAKPSWRRGAWPWATQAPPPRGAPRVFASAATLSRGPRPGCALALVAVVPAIAIVAERLPAEHAALPVRRPSTRRAARHLDLLARRSQVAGDTRGVLHNGEELHSPLATGANEEREACPRGTSNPNVRLRSSAHGRYPPLRTLFSGSSSSLAGGGGGVPRGEAAR